MTERGQLPLSVRKSLFALFLVAGLSLSVSVRGAEELSGYNYYFGIGVEKDYARALSLFRAEKDAAFLILMYLNGDGTPVDVAKANEIWNQADFPPEIQLDATMSLLRDMIKERAAAPGRTYPRLEFCEIAMTTLDMNRCGFYHLKLAEQDNVRLVEQALLRMTPAAQSALRDVVRHFEALKEHGGASVRAENSDGTIRTMERLGHEIYLVERHEKRIQALLIDRRLARVLTAA